MVTPKCCKFNIFFEKNFRNGLRLSTPICIALLVFWHEYIITALIILPWFLAFLHMRQGKASRASGCPPDTICQAVTHTYIWLKTGRPYRPASNSVQFSVKDNTQIGVVFFLVETTGLDLHFCPAGKNYGSHQCLRWWQELPTGQFHCYGFEAVVPIKKDTTQ